MTTPFLVGIRVIAGLMLCVACMPAVADTTGQYSIAPPSSWIRSEHQFTDASTPGPAAQRKVDYLLVDRQVRVGDRGSSRYTRYVERILNQAGVDAESHLTITFDPQSERPQLPLCIHSAHVDRSRVIRGFAGGGRRRKRGRRQGAGQADWLAAERCHQRRDLDGLPVLV